MSSFLQAQTYSLAKNPPSGYKARFVTSLLKRHECPICLCAMRDPVQTECGHLFCKGCLEPVLEGPNPVCPIEKNKISRIEVRLVFNIQIMHLFT